MNDELNNFFMQSQHPLVVVSTLLEKDREAVIEFLLELQAPVYLEGVSSIREESRLEHLRIGYLHDIWNVSKAAGYEIDGILRIGGVPTFRPWRDLEEKKEKVAVCSISQLPFSGLSWAKVTHVDLSVFFQSVAFPSENYFKKASGWLEQDHRYTALLLELFQEEPKAEPSLFHALSKIVPDNALIYLGNSLPIREWDLAATVKDRECRVYASRGLNGIDGQVSTFLGMAQPDRTNWGIFGDLTMLYDLAGPWILPQLEGVLVNIVVVNNGGGMIFKELFDQSEFQNPHCLNFESIARHWGLSYYRGDQIPKDLSVNHLIELIPDSASTTRFWERYRLLGQENTCAI